MFKKYALKTLGIFLVLFSSNLYSQNTIVDDPLNGSTVGQVVGGNLTSEGFNPGKGEGHILYKLPQIVNGYVEFEVKGFNPSKVAADEDHGFLGMYDGRGISEPIKYFNDFKYNYFRWNLHWRENRGAFKAVLTCAAPTNARLNSNYAVFPGGGDLRDWFSEPTGKGWSWNTNSWYTVRVEWRNKQFKVTVNGSTVWSTSGPYDYAPKDFRIWLGSAPGKYGSDVSTQVFRNFKVVSYGGAVTPSNNLSVNPSSRSVGSSAGSTTFDVSSNVSWNASSNASWLTVSPTSGSNNKTLTANYGENTGSSSRSATVTVSGGGITQKVTVTQSGVSATNNSLTVSPSSRNVGSAAGQTTFAVSSNVDWSVSENAGWLSVSPPSGKNNGTLQVSFAENTGSNSRTASISVSGAGITRTVNVTQTGSSTSGGSRFIDVPDVINLTSKAGQVVVDVKANVSWKVSDNTGASGWISKSPKTGTGDGQVTVKYKENTGSSSREGALIFVGGGITKTVKVIQSGKSSGGSNSLALNPSSRNVGSNSGSTSFGVTSNVSWTVSKDASWVTLASSSGSNNGTINANFTKNTSNNSRTATITVSGGGITRMATIVQSGTANTGGGNYINVPEIINLPNGSGTIAVNVESNVSWKVSDNTGSPGWLSKTPKTGTGNGQVSVRYKANPSSSSREGALIFVGGGITKTVRVIQGNTGSTGGGNDFLTVPETLNLPSGGGVLTVNVQANVSWKVSDNTGTPGWLSKSPKTGTGSGEVKLKYKANPGSSSREGQLIFNADGMTKTITIVQAGSNATLSKANSDVEIAMDKVDEIPSEFSIGNYPNPFNPTTTIQYSLPEGGFTQLVVYNSIGEVITTLISDYKTAGTHSVSFNGSNLSSGIYFYRLTSGKQTLSGKMMLME